MHTKTLGLLAGLTLLSGSAVATPQIGYTSQSTRTQIAFNLYSTQWDSSPLFNFVLQTSPGAWGYDLIHATNTFAPASADGTPSQSGWHSHPVPIGLVQNNPGRPVDAGRTQSGVPHLLSDRVHVHRKRRACSQRLQLRQKDASGDNGHLVPRALPPLHASRPTGPSHGRSQRRVRAASFVVYG